MVGGEKEGNRLKKRVKDKAQSVFAKSFFFKKKMYKKYVFENRQKNIRFKAWKLYIR